MNIWRCRGLEVVPQGVVVPRYLLSGPCLERHGETESVLSIVRLCGTAQSHHKHAAWLVCYKLLAGMTAVLRTRDTV